MERTGTAVAAMREELDDLKHLFSGADEVVTAWVNRPGPTPHEIEARVRAELTAAPERWPAHRGEALASALAAALRDGAGAVVVVADRVLHAEPLVEPLRQEATFTGALPALAPVIESRQRDIAAVVVRLDRRGADIAWTGDGSIGSATVAGEDRFITKVQAGGWSHATYHRFAENAWEQTATETAETLERVATAIDARTVLLAADVRMGELLRRHVSAPVRDKLHEVTGARSEDGSQARRDAEIERWLRTAVAEDTTATLRAFDEQRQRLEPLAVTGAEDIFAALRAAQVDVLLVNDAADDEPIAYFDAADPSSLGLTENELSAAREPRLARRCDVAIRSALLSGGGVRVVPRGHQLDDGLGALLRWPGRPAA